MKLFAKLLPYAILLALVFIIGILNFKPDTLLTGWDNLHPEANIWLNIKRSIFSVWQEHQSLGLLGGMGHAADLPRQLVIALFSLFLPENIIRFLWTMLTLFIGGMGSMVLIRNLLSHSSFSRHINTSFTALLGGIFYILNLATLQQYFIPFETFTSHFAFLPWMILTTLHFFNKQSKKNALLLFITLFLTSPQSYVPTLFVVYLISAGILLLGSSYVLLQKKRFILLFKIALKYISIVVFANAYWLLSFAYFTITNASINVNAKINQMATENIILQNKEAATPFNATLLKGFWFNSVEPNLQGVQTYLLSPWKNHIESLPITVIGLILFVIIVIGVISALKRREPLLTSFTLLFLFSFIILAHATPPFSWVIEAFRSIPLLEQAFRFPFTKFSLLAALCYAIFFAFGATTISSALGKLARKVSNSIQLIFSIAVTGSLIILIGIFMLPVFQGHLFSEKVQLSVPEDYHNLRQYFAKEDPSKRIATLPIDTFWAWYYYDWGYGGSGFLWYGIQQPIVNKNFDVWSKNSENSYNELSYALYSQNPTKFLQVLNKYDIQYLVVDKHHYSPFSPKSLFYSQTEELLTQIPQVKKDKSFGKIDVYTVRLNKEVQNFIYTTGNLPSVNSYSYNNNDISYSVLGDYKTDSNVDVAYPFRNLFTGKEQKDREFSIEKKGSSYQLTTTVPSDNKNKTLIIPSFARETAIPVAFYFAKSETGISVTYRFLTPEVTINNKQVVPPSQIQELQSIDTPINTYNVAVNNTPFSTPNPSTVTALLTKNQMNYLTITDASTGDSYTFQLPIEEILSLPYFQAQTVPLAGANKYTVSVTIPAIEDTVHGTTIKAENFLPGRDCNRFRNGKIEQPTTSEGIRLSSTNDTLCNALYVPTLIHQHAYIIEATAQHIKGKPLHFWVLNTTNEKTIIDTYLSRDHETNYFILPPMEQYGLGYSFHTETMSLGQTPTENLFKKLTVSPIPYNFISNFIIRGTYEPQPNTLRFASSHPNESLYILSNLKFANNRPTTIVLSQSYDPGWKAYLIQSKEERSKIKNLLIQAFPFFFGKEITSHVKVNNWANGWEINSYNLQPTTYNLVIVYLPQYLQYIGFLGLLFPLLLFTLPLFKRIKTPYIFFNSFFERKAQSIKTKLQ